MNDTPRTNHMLTAILETHGHVGFLNCPPTWVALARELERELNAANNQIKQLADESNELRAEEARLLNTNGELLRRITRLEKAGDEMFKWSERVGQEYWTKAKEAKT